MEINRVVKVFIIENSVNFLQVWPYMELLDKKSLFKENVCMHLHIKMRSRQFLENFDQKIVFFRRALIP